MWLPDLQQIVGLLQMQHKFAALVHHVVLMHVAIEVAV